MPFERHELIFKNWDDLKPGETLQITNDHDLKPLRYVFEAEYKNQFEWEYVQKARKIGSSGLRGCERGDKTMAEKEFKSVDPATREMLEKAAQDGARVVFERTETIKPCPIGAEGGSHGAQGQGIDLSNGLLSLISS